MNLRKTIKLAGVICLLIFAVLLYISQPYLNVDRKENTRNYKERFVEVLSSFQKDIDNSNVPDVRENLVASAAVDSKLCCTCDSHVSKENDKREFEFFTGKYSLDKEPFVTWAKLQNRKSYCDNRVHVFNDIFAILHNVTMFPLRRTDVGNHAKGGEEIRHVLNQAVYLEEYKFDNGFLEMGCKSDIGSKLPTSTIKTLRSLRFSSSEPKIPLNNASGLNGKYFVAIRRQDYANLHNWVRNIYNTFVLLMHFRLQPKDICVIFMDGHPRTALDNAWKVLYNQPLRVGHIEQNIKFQNLILAAEENKGPITEFHLDKVPYLEEFRSFVLSKFKLDPLKERNCSSPRITVILRRNAVYHPRNVAGNVGRKIFNEEELMNDLMTAFPNACVNAALMEALPMRSQLNLIKDTDLFIGMHGAGMSHVTFLPKHAGILELFAKNFKTGRPWYVCFERIAKWRSLHYDSWENFDKSLEMPSDFTVLPTKVIVDKAQGLMKKICPR